VTQKFLSPEIRANAQAEAMTVYEQVCA